MKKNLIYIFLLLIGVFVYYATLHKQNLGFGFPYFDAYVFIEDAKQLIVNNVASRFSDSAYIYIYSSFKLLLNMGYENVHIFLSFLQLLLLSLGLLMARNGMKKNAGDSSLLLSFIFFYFSGIVAWRLTPGFRENFFIIYIPVVIFLTQLKANAKIFFLINLFYLSSIFSHQLIFYILTPVYLKYVYSQKLFSRKFIGIYLIFGIGFLPFLKNIYISFFDQMTSGSDFLKERAWTVSLTLLRLDTSLTANLLDVKNLPVLITILFISSLHKVIRRKFVIFFLSILYIYLLSFTEKFGIQQNRLGIFILFLIGSYLAYSYSKNYLNRIIFILVSCFTLVIYTPILLNYKSFFTVSDKERIFTKELIILLKPDVIYCANSSCIGIKLEIDVQDWYKVKYLASSEELQDIGLTGQTIILFTDDANNLRNELIKYKRNNVYIISQKGWTKKVFD